MEHTSRLVADIGLAVLVVAGAALVLATDQWLFLPAAFALHFLGVLFTQSPKSDTVTGEARQEERARAVRELAEERQDDRQTVG